MKTKEDLVKYVRDNWFPGNGWGEYHKYFIHSRASISYNENDNRFYQKHIYYNNAISFEEVLKMIKKENLHKNFQ